MESNMTNQKITTEHLNKSAYLYIRQSTIRQVLENQESTKRQYALRERAVALGWSIENIVVIDSDLGKSGADTDREGFQRLVAAVSLGSVGMVLGLEVSRLARNSMDWQRLLEMCALSGTLILDEEGIYDPSYFNDRLLLGLKGTMSEAELHVIRARLQGGIINKARRGELRIRLPVGLAYNTEGHVQHDPDQQIQAAIRLLFSTFKRLNSACAVVRYFSSQKIKFPRRPHKGPNKGILLWGELEHSRVLQILHNPSYAGAFVFGRTKTKKDIEGKSHSRKIDRAQWEILIQNHHPAYLTWEEYEANLKQLKENAQALGHDRRKSPPKEGPALLQGIVICGHCGLRMTVRYGTFAGKVVPRYVCQREGIKKGEPICQYIPGNGIDAAIEKLLLETVTPMTLDITLAVENELKGRLSEKNNVHQQQVERAKYESNLARRRFMQVDPDNRLVANTLEAEWNEKLRTYRTAQDEYEKQHKAAHAFLNNEQLNQIKQLADNFPKVWNSPSTSNREKKRLTRLIIEDVTLSKKEKIAMQIRFKGGATTTLNLPLPKSSWELKQTDQIVVKEIDCLLNYYKLSEVAKKLNDQELRSGWGKKFNRAMVARLCKHYNLKNRYERLREQGLLTAKEMATILNVTVSTIDHWRLQKLLRYQSSTDKGGYLYENPGADAPIKGKWKNRNKQQDNKVLTNHTMEVQCAT